MARYKAICCKVLLREMYQQAALSKNVVTIQWMQQALHNEPEKLRRRVQEAIDQTETELETERYDAILLGYGLCSNGVANLKARSIPLVIPRGHDCITLLLGDKKRYQQLFDEKRGGIYWYSTGWYENARLPSKARYEELYREYAEKYGEDNAEYLLKLEQTWMKEYDQAIYIRWPGFEDEEFSRKTKESADFLGWSFREVAGDSGLLARMLAGEWDKKEFLVVPPGRRVRPTYDERIIGLTRPEEDEPKPQED